MSLLFWFKKFMIWSSKALLLLFATLFVKKTSVQILLPSLELYWMWISSSFLLLRMKFWVTMRLTQSKPFSLENSFFCLPFFFSSSSSSSLFVVLISVIPPIFDLRRHWHVSFDATFIRRLTLIDLCVSVKISAERYFRIPHFWFRVGPSSLNIHFCF